MNRCAFILGIPLVFSAACIPSMSTAEWLNIETRDGRKYVNMDTVQVIKKFWFASGLDGNPMCGASLSTLGGSNGYETVDFNGVLTESDCTNVFNAWVAKVIPSHRSVE